MKHMLCIAKKGNDRMNFFDKEPKFIQEERSKLRDYIQRGISAFLVILAGIICFFIFLRFESIAKAIGTIAEVLAPIIYGFVLAFLLNPIVKRVEGWVTPGLKKLLKKEEGAQKTARSIGIFSGLIVAIVVVVALLNMLIPELYKSIKDLVITLPEELGQWGKDINTLIKGHSTVDTLVKSLLIQGQDAIGNWVENDLMSWVQNDLFKQTNQIITGVTTGVISVVNVVLNILVGVIVSIYVLYSKEKFASQSKKIVYAMMKPTKANNLIHIAKKANTIFTGFIIGKIIDSAIIGALCFIGLSILKMPYTLLVSVIVGVTNIIPFFGPFIGAIPSAILIMLVDPLKGLYFVIFVLLLQQLDGNIIGPKILGDSTGLSSFWVIFSILVSGGLFGFAGMIVGVPTFALIYYIIKMYIQQKLEQKKLPTDTECYTETNYVDEEGNFISIEEIKKEEEKEDADSSTE